jgi:beta-lactamase superfamily II metal-dependent hydrolase
MTRLLVASGWQEILLGAGRDKQAAVRISISTPTNPAAYRPFQDQNALSAILRVAVGEAAFLVPGDATLDRWRDALSQAQQNGESLLSDGVLLPFHGSKSCMSSGILSRITKPTGFLAAVEPSKRFGLPRVEILQSVERLGGRVISFSATPVHLRLEEEGLFHRVGAR